MRNQIEVFSNEKFGKIRTVEINGEIWFVGKDVAMALGYTDTFGALKKHVDSEDKQNCQNSSFESPRGLTIINESGLYSLILSSKLESAKDFKHWVTKEVLPSIRKTGSYSAENVMLIDRARSKQIRNMFTGTLHSHGYEKQHEYIQTTLQMKKALGINAKKSEMSLRQLAMVGASEMLSIATVGDEHGYREVNPVCVDASEAVAGYVESKTLTRKLLSR